MTPKFTEEMAWIFNVKNDNNIKGEDIYDHRMQDGFWGLHKLTGSGKRTANVASLREGDKVLFYWVGKDGQRFLGTCVLASIWRELKPDETDKRHDDWGDWPEGVDLKKESIENWKRAHSTLSIERLPFITIKQGSVIKITPEEYDRVIREHNNQR